MTKEVVFSPDSTSEFERVLRLKALAGGMAGADNEFCSDVLTRELVTSMRESLGDNMTPQLEAVFASCMRYCEDQERTYEDYVAELRRNGLDTDVHQD